MLKGMQYGKMNEWMNESIKERPKTQLQYFCDLTWYFYIKTKRNQDYMHMSLEVENFTSLLLIYISS